MTNAIDLERDLIQECRLAAKAMSAYLLEVGQRRAKGSGTSRGFPDLTLVCAGRVVLIEAKRPATPEHPQGYISLDQQVVIERAAAQSVVVPVIDSVEGFAAIVNACRRGTLPR